MNDVELAVRETLHELAEEGRPVVLGRRALANVRRRRARRARAASAVAAIALAVGLAPRLLGGDAPPAAPSPDLSGLAVIAAYHTYAAVQVLDPATGRYRPTELNVTSVSADLRFAAGPGPAGYVTTFPEQEPRLGILDTRTGELGWLPMPQAFEAPVWSPDGRRLVARVDDQKYSRAVLVDPAKAETIVVSLQVPTGYSVLDLCWAEADRLLAVAAPPPGAPTGPDRRLLVLDTYGDLLRDIPVSSDWQITCASRNGRVVATRLAPHTPGTALVPPEVMVIDVRRGAVGQPRTLPWAGAIEPVAWRSDDTVVAFSGERVVVVDVDDGTATAVPGVGRNFELFYTVFVAGDGLTDHAAEVADAAF